MSTQIEIRNAQIVFPLFDSQAKSIRAKLAKGRYVDGNHSRSFTALDDISLAIQSGENVGLLGRNGAGKSTFLRMLAGVYPPKSGEVIINGDVTSLFEVNVGVDADASGYENIPLLMAARGIPLSELSEITKDIEEFTELGEALNRPMRTYSAGMRLRIAFAIATVKSADVLLVDEVVGAGDRDFRVKSQDRIKRLMHGAGTLLLASHSASVLKTHCQRGLVFSKGKIVFDGGIDEAIAFSQNT